jgi:hypothetical protein
VRAELARRRIRVLAYVPESALMVSAAGPLPLEGLNVLWDGALEPSDKLSPALAGDATPAWLVVYHPDVQISAAREAARSLGFDVLDHPSLLPGQILVTGAYQRLPLLAARDETAYILPASAELLAGAPVAACAGPLTEAGPVAEYALVGDGWPRDSSGGVSLGYFFNSLSGKMDPIVARAELERAFLEWTRYAPLMFRANSGPGQARSIDVLFGRRSHGDAFPFDGAFWPIRSIRLR